MYRSRVDNMRSKILWLFFIALAYPASVASSHHSFADTCLEDEVASIEGELINFMYRNPHAIVHVIVEGENGETERQSIEWGAVTQLNKQGVNRFTLKPGDRVVVTGAPGRNADDPRLLMRAIERPSDGWTWGRRPEEVFD